MCGKKRKKEEDDGAANGIAASGVPIQADGRGAHQSLPPVEDQRPSFRGPGHPRSRCLQMGALGFAWVVGDKDGRSGVVLLLSA